MDASLFTNEAWGRLTRTTQGNTAFVPAPAPRDVSLSPTAIAVLDAASNRLGVLEGIARRLPNPDLLIAPYLRREAVLSSRIEGTLTTLGDLYVTEAQLDLDVPADVQEVLNYVSTYAYGLERLQTLPLSLRLLQELHARLMAGVRGGGKHPGDFRTYQNFIGGTDEQNARYVPPPPLEMKECLHDLDVFMNDRSLRPLVQMAVLHYQFEAIHPFADGNGRVGRLLTGLFLTERGLMPQPLLYLSAYFERSRSAYYDGLLRVSTHGDWDGWIRYVLDGVRVQSDEAITLADRLQALHASYRERLQRARATVNALALVDHLFITPLLTTRTVKDHLGVTHPTARAAIRTLEAAGILREFTPERRWGKAFTADEIYALISGTGGGVPRPRADRATAATAG